MTRQDCDLTKAFLVVVCLLGYVSTRSAGLVEDASPLRQRGGGDWAHRARDVCTGLYRDGVNGD